MLLHSVSLRMRNKGLIITDDLLPLSASLAYISFLLPGEEKTKQYRNTLYSVKDFSPINPDSSSTNSSSTPVTHHRSQFYGHCAHYLSLKHSIFQRSVRPQSPQTTVLIRKRSQGIPTVFTECSILAHIKTLNQFHSYLIFHLAFCLATPIFLAYRLFITSLG